MVEGAEKEKGRGKRKRDAMNRAPTTFGIGKSGKRKEKERGHGPSKLRVNVPCPYESLGKGKTLRKGRRRSGFLSLTTEEGRYVQVVRGDFVAYFADVLLDLVD